jgi:5-methylcytosine-specific restriction endonuclease McrA
MPTRFSQLTKTKKSKLYKEITSKYEQMSESELDEAYRSLKYEYDRLGAFTKRQRQSEETLKKLKGILDNSEKEMREKERRENLARQAQHSKRGFFERMFRSAPATSTSKRPGPDPEGNVLKNRIGKAKENIAQHKVFDFPEEAAKRGKIYHELRAISLIRKKFRDQRTKSLARAKVGSVRSTSQITKKKALSSAGAIEVCPYCDGTFSLGMMVLDHIYPVSKGGLDTTSNTVLSCRPCNSRKTNKTIAIFCVEMGFDFVKVINRLRKKGKDV